MPAKRAGERSRIRLMHRLNRYCFRRLGMSFTFKIVLCGVERPWDDVCLWTLSRFMNGVPYCDEGVCYEKNIIISNKT